jgi:alanine dehydrogenase
MEMRYLNLDDLEGLQISMADMMAAVEEGFRRKALGQTQMTAKAFVSPRPGASLMSLSAYIEGVDAVGVKWLGSRPANRQCGLPLHTGLIILSDPETTLPMGIVDAAWVTAMRTAAANGVAMKHLGPKVAAAGAIVGCGVEGRAALQAMLACYPDIAEVRCYDLAAEAAEALAHDAREQYGVRAVATPDAQSAVVDADAVVTATSTGATPFLKAEWLKAGASQRRWTCGERGRRTSRPGWTSWWWTTTASTRPSGGSSGCATFRSRTRSWAR